MGGDCKFTNNLSKKFAWGLRIPGLDHSVRCKYCNTVVKIARGLFALKQHEQSAMHKKNMPSTSSRTPNIAAALYTSCSKETGVLRATIYHCLKIIVDDASFRSSECFSRNRSFYKVMFPDSSFAAINCGKTKTGYIITRAIAPFVRDQVTDKITSCDRVGIHMDESSYHKKCRLEFWIVHFDGELRKNSYLRTIELEAKFSVDEFLNDSVKKLSDVEFVGSSAVFDAFCTVPAEFKLNYEQIAYVMTDNCNTMRGERSGAVKKIGDVCLNLVSVPGCSVHLANLIAKDVCTANPCLSEVIEFISSLSSLLQTTPKAQSMLSQVEEYLKLPGLPSFSSTRFLCLFTLVSGITDQLNIHTFIMKLMQFFSKLFARIGHSIELFERGYYPKLFDEDGQIKVFEIQKSELLYSSSNPAVLKALNEANQSELDKIKQDWDRANEGVLNAALRRFSSYLSNDIVRLFYIFHIPLEQFTAKTIRNLVRMAGLLKVDTGTVHDDFAALRVVSDAKASLQVLHGKGALSDYPHIKVLFETAHLISPHNMNVESGFSTMKFAESSYRTNLGCETYDALRWRVE